MRRCREGDLGAREVLCQRFMHRILGWAEYLRPKRKDPQDVAQEVMEEVLFGRTQFRGEGNLTGWLFRITSDKCRSRRLLDRRSSSIDDLGREPRNPTDERDPLVIEKVRLALSKVSFPQRQVLVLCEMEGYSAPEASSLLGVPVGTIASRRRLGRAAFARQMAMLGYEPSSGGDA